MSTSRPLTPLALCLSIVLFAGCTDRAESANTATAAAADDASIATAAPVTAMTSPASTAPAEPGAQAAQPSRTPDVIYVPTPEPVVQAMLKLAEVKPGDVLYDLGSGDGRIPIAAAKQHGVRGTGIDIDPERIREANANAQQAGVTKLVTFKQEDLFKADFSDATVVTLYLLDSLNEKLRPKLLAELEPGTRIVSHAFRMGDWEPEQTETVGTSTIYRWTVPERK
jgi:precorrin-6B methylase 2